MPQNIIYVYLCYNFYYLNILYNFRINIFLFKKLLVFLMSSIDTRIFSIFYIRNDFLDKIFIKKKFFYSFKKIKFCF